MPGAQVRVGGGIGPVQEEALVLRHAPDHIHGQQARACCWCGRRRPDLAARPARIPALIHGPKRRAPHSQVRAGPAIPFGRGTPQLGIKLSSPPTPRTRRPVATYSYRTGGVALAATSVRRRYRTPHTRHGGVPAGRSVTPCACRRGTRAIDLCLRVEGVGLGRPRSYQRRGLSGAIRLRVARCQLGGQFPGVLANRVGMAVNDLPLPVLAAEDSRGSKLVGHRR